MSTQPPSWKQQRLDALERQARARSQNKLLSFQGYPRQIEFFQLGLTKRERAFLAANRVGKSLACCVELAMHLIGEYPEWWPGKRFHKPIVAWACSESAAFSRDVAQLKLLGAGPAGGELWGTGLIPKRLIGTTSASHGAGFGIDQAFIKHSSGGTSVLAFKSYQAGREVFQGAELDVAYCDEEPPEDVYAEILTRLTGQGVAFCALTPLKGRTPFVRRFMDDRSEEAVRDRAYVKMGIADARHFSEEEKAIRIAGYLPHEREARQFGTPKRGEGWVWEGVQRSDVEETLRLADVPGHWTKIWGIDFGSTHPFAAVLLAVDRDSGCVHVVEAFRIKGAVPVIHANRMKAICATAPVAWPRDGDNVEKSTGEDLIESYRRAGLRLLSESARHKTGGVSVWQGITEMRELMLKGQFKIASHLHAFWEEWENYHVDDGKIAKTDDDLMDACRYGVMMLRYAKDAAFGSQVNYSHRPTGQRFTNPWRGTTEFTYR